MTDKEKLDTRQIRDQGALPQGYENTEDNQNTSSKNYDEEGVLANKTIKKPFQLRNRFRLSFRIPNDSTTNINYQLSFIKIGDIETIEDFWNYYCHIYRPQDMQVCEFNLFLSNIQPMWEDSANLGGGRFNIKMKKGYSNKIWEDLLMGFIGETCEEKDLLNGLILKIKPEQDIISLWVKSIPKVRQQAKSKIQIWIAETIGLDPSLAASTFSYQPHQIASNKPHQSKENSQNTFSRKQ